MNSDMARARIRAGDGLRAFISLTDEGGPGPCVGVKDNVDVRGTVTTAGARLLPTSPALADAPVIARIREHGCLVVGKTNLHEWALGTTSANRHYGRVINPVTPERIPGGSSGGSAAAVAAGLCDWAIGTDTGGSIRNPASYCGVVGVRPSPGLVSTEGVFPNAPSLDTVGVLAPDVATAARALEMMSGRQGLVPVQVPPVDGLRLAVPGGWVQGLDPETGRAWERVTRNCLQVAWPDRSQLLQLFDTIYRPEVSAVHRQWIEGNPEAYEPDVRARIESGFRVPAVDYLEGLELRSRLAREADAALAGWDALLVPTSPCVAPLVGEQAEVWQRVGQFTRPISVLPLPVISLPVPGAALPIGIQLVGSFGGEAALFGVARALERAWAQDRP